MIGRPLSSQTVWSLEFSPPLVRPIRRGQPLFEQARRRAMGLEMRRVDHDALRLGSLAGEPCEDAVEDAEPAPADEAVVERLVGTVALGRVLPLQAVADDVDDPAHHAPIIDPWHAMRERKMRRYPRHLPLAQQKQIIHHSVLPDTVNHRSNEFNRS